MERRGAGGGKSPKLPPMKSYLTLLSFPHFY
jgi:hypothetical protein